MTRTTAVTINGTSAAQSGGYRLPWQVTPGLALDLIHGRPRSLAADCRRMVARIQPPPRVTGARTIPAAPFVLVANHFEGPGLWIGWTAALLTHAYARIQREQRTANPAPLHWLVLAEMDRTRVDGWKKLIPGTSWAFRRVALVWGLVPLPRPEAPAARRATALRRLIRLASPPPRGAGEPVAFFPEGEGDGLAGLRAAPAAAGDLLALLGRQGVPAVPAAVWLAEGRLTARIGPAWLPVAGGEAGATEAMTRIGVLLPRAMWGPYTRTIDARGEG